jgi:Tfp pilus assembly protein PilO
MAKMNTSMTENMAKNDAADAAMKTHMDAMKESMKSDMEMKHAMMAQLQAMSDQIQQLNDKVAALTAQLTPSPVAGKAKAAKAKVRPPTQPEAH